MDPGGSQDNTDTEELDELDGEEDALTLRKPLVGSNKDGSEDSEGASSKNNEDSSDVHFQVVILLFPDGCALILLLRDRTIGSAIEVRREIGREGWLS